MTAPGWIRQMNESDLTTIHHALSTYAVRAGVSEEASDEAANLAAVVWSELCRRSVIRHVRVTA